MALVHMVPAKAVVAARPLAAVANEGTKAVAMLDGVNMVEMGVTPMMMGKTMGMSMVNPTVAMVSAKVTIKKTRKRKKVR